MSEKKSLAERRAEAGLEPEISPARRALMEAQLRAAEEDRRSGMSDDTQAPVDEPTTPWDNRINHYQMRMLDTYSKRPGYEMQWIEDADVGNYLRRGWNLCRPEDYGELVQVLPGEEGNTSVGYIRRRELVAIEIPKERYDELIELKKYKARRQRDSGRRQFREIAKANDVPFVDNTKIDGRKD